MVHQLSHQRRGHLLHHLVKQYGRHHGQGQSVLAVSYIVSHFLVRQTDHVLAIDLQYLVVGQQAVSGSRTVLDDAGDLAVVENQTSLTAVVCSGRERKSFRNRKQSGISGF